MNSFPRGVIKIRNEGLFWGVYIPKTNEFIVSKRMGDIKKVLFDHLKVTSMVRPEVLLVSADEEYDRKISDLRIQANSSPVYEEGKASEIVEVVARFALQEIPIKIVAEFFVTSKKQINELMSKDV